MSNQSAIDFYIDVREMRAAQKLLESNKIPVDSLKLKSEAEQRVDDKIAWTENYMKKNGIIITHS